MPSKSKIISVVGARPNFMKVAPIHRAFQNYSKFIDHIICHTGQHYDEKMSKIFFDDLELPKPKYYLGVGSGSHAFQTGKIMIEFEKVLISEKPDLVIVVGDVNSTIACTLTAVKLGIETAHVEAGLRSFDRSMPEEVNRILTDAIADILFVTEKSGVVNLKREGIDDRKIHLVGNVMIDSLNYYLRKSENSQIIDRLNVTPNNFILVTMHRPSNVDNSDSARKLIELLNKFADEREIIFPVHPRTKKNWKEFGLMHSISKQVKLLDPLGYRDFIQLLKNCELVLTDSGGIQEETTFLGIQCITLRTTTERPITIEVGTNHLLGNDLDKAFLVGKTILEGKSKKGKIPEFWDGKTAERIVKIIFDKLNNH